MAGGFHKENHKSKYQTYKVVLNTGKKNEARILNYSFYLSICYFSYYIEDREGKALEKGGAWGPPWEKEE